MYAKASPFSLELAMLVREQVYSLLSELKERSHEQEPTGRVSRSCKMVDMFGFFIAMAHGLFHQGGSRGRDKFWKHLKPGTSRGIAACLEKHLCDNRGGSGRELLIYHG